MKLALGLLLAAGAIVLVWFFGAQGEADSRGGVLPQRSASSVHDVEPRPGHVPGTDGTRGAVPEQARAGGEPVAAGSTARASQRGDASVRLLARAVTAEGLVAHGAWLAARDIALGVARGDGQGRLELVLPAGELEFLLGLQQGRVLELEVGAPGFVTHRLRRSLAEGEGELELGDVVLVPGGAVYGRVVDEVGLGVEGAVVVFGRPITAEVGRERGARSGPGELWARGSRQGYLGVIGRSGPGGAFRLEGAAAGHGTVWARTGTSLWSMSEPIGVRAGDEIGEVVLVVHDAAERVISGVVTDPSGRALPGTFMRISAAGTTEGWGQVRTDGEGRFHYICADETPRDITVESPSWEWDAVRVIGVSPGTRDLVLVFEPSKWLWVSVRDGDGRPIGTGRAAALRSDESTDRSRRFPRGESTLGPDGRGRLRLPDEPLRVLVEAPGYRLALLGPFEPEHFPDPLVVTLERAPAIVGQVLRADGEPAARARVSLHRGASVGAELPRFTHATWAGDREPFVYALHHRPKIWVESDERGRFRLTLPGVDTRADGEAQSPPDIDPARLARIQARIDVRAATAIPEEPTWYVQASAPGEATATAGPYRFEVDGDVELDLALPRAGAIAGKLVLEDGGSPAGWTAVASNGLAEIVEAQVAGDGSFHLAALHPGGWQVRVFEPEARFYPLAGTSPTERTPLHDVRVSAGRTTAYEHRASARPRARLLGQLRIDGAPPGAWSVTVIGRGGSGVEMLQATVDPDGRFSVSMAPAAKASLSLTGSLDEGSRAEIYEELEVTPGDNDWSLDVERASLEALVDPARLPATLMRPASYRTELDRASVMVSLPIDAEGRLGPVTVPAGPSALSGPAANWSEQPATWAELDLRPGEARKLDLR